jgi:hypothetical protein
MTGQSNPPPDDYNTLSTRNAQYNAQAQQGNDSVGQQYPQPGVAPAGNSGAARRRTTRPAASSRSAPQSAPLPAMTYPNVVQSLSSSNYPDLGQPAPQGVPPTDADLMAKSVPPLRGSYDPRASVVPRLP